jgi:hypothetical protein
MVEQINMASPWKNLDPLWFVGGSKEPHTHFYRDYSILLAVKDQNGRRYRLDIFFVIVFVCDEQTDR